MESTRRRVLAALLAGVAGCSGQDAGSSDRSPTTDGTATGETATGTTTGATTTGTTTADGSGGRQTATTTAGEATTGGTTDAPTGRPDLRLGFVGDVMLGREVNGHWSDPDDPPEGVWGETLDRLRSLDGLFCNLECCVSDRGRKREGRTYHFRADPDWSVPALRAAGTTFASLANNHVLDYGPEAFADTLDHLSGAGIATAGAGPSLSAALEPAVVDVGGLTVGVVAFTDRSPSYGASPDGRGTAFAALDPEEESTRSRVSRALSRVREADPDLVVASLHWGPNWEVRPSTTQETFAHWLIDRGVDVVHGHSAHVLQGIETYRGRPILYDCGDYVDDYLYKDGYHNKRSFLFVLRVTDGRPAALELHPVQIYDESVHPAGDEEAEWLRERMTTLSGEFDTTVRREGEGLVVPL